VEADLRRQIQCAPCLFEFYRRRSLQTHPREFVRDPVLLEFLGLPNTGKLLESGLEQSLIEKLQALLLELGKGFAFVARQQRISTD
jgi:predicted nuclease of restriction endonuclease-like (RecB) superfamily